MNKKLGRKRKGVLKLWTSTEQRVWITMSCKYRAGCGACDKTISVGSKMRWNKITGEKRHMMCGVR